MIGEELAKEFIVPFKDIKDLSGKVLSGKASYEESVSYGRALAKAASAVMLVKAAATAGVKGAKLASKSSKELLESLPKITEQFRRYEFVTPEGIRVKVPAWEADGTISYSKNPRQQNFIEAMKEQEGKGNIASPDAIRKVDKNILDRMESAGGHTLERHVSKTNEELIKRAIQEDVEAATSFTDKSTAIKAIQENLRKNADDIAKWLNESDTGRKILDSSHTTQVGKGVLEDKKQVIYGLTHSRVVLIRDSTQELGFRILTGFPIVK